MTYEEARISFRKELESNKLFIPTSVILERNWEHISIFKKLKYLFKYRNRYEAKLNLSIDYKLENEGYEKN